MNKPRLNPNRVFLVSEILVLFAGIPILLATNPILWISVAIAFFALGYVFIVAKQEWQNESNCSIWSMIKSAFAASRNTKQKTSRQLTRIFIQWALFAFCCVAYVHLTMPENLFHVLINRPGLWIAICFVYCFLSVLPQEFVYRTFFFKRYSVLMLPSAYFVLLNAVAFSLAHLMFHNELVMILTFAGGLLFGYTYQKTHSFWIVCIEHALYGLWLFTVGMGAMLAFPGG